MKNDLITKVFIKFNVKSILYLITTYLNVSQALIKKHLDSIIHCIYNICIHKYSHNFIYNIYFY